jgi:TonB-linked SusC/RagA family outer membrane protein
MENKILKLFMSIMIVFLAFHSFAQVQVSGVVRDNTGDLLPGVSIQVKGTTQGVVTDTDGRFSINVPNNQSVLVFSFVGMETQEVNVSGRSVIDVVLSQSTIGVDEVVVTALGITRQRKTLGYAVSEVEGEALQRVAHENVLNSLSGRVAGVAINSTGGPGSSVSMVIRGASSLTSDNQPLFVIDGVPVNNTLRNVGGVGDRNMVDYGNAISDLNPEDIESVSVLKGPSAAALYGSRAGNGVVLITTKSGKGSRGLGVTVTSNTVFESPYKFLETHNMFANGRRPYTQDSRPTTGLPYYLVPAADSYWVGPELDKGMMGYVWPYFDAEGNLTPRELVSHPDNYKEFFRTAITSQNGVSVTNDTERVNYRLSLNNMQNRGMIPNSDLQRTSVNLNSSVKLTSNLTVNSSINFTTSGADNRPAGDRGANPMEPVIRGINPSIDIREMRNYWEPGQEGLMQRGPYNLIVNPDGTYSRGEMSDNPWFLAYEVNNSFRRDRAFGNGQLEWKIAPEFTFMARYAHDQFHERRETKMAPSYSRDANGVYGITNMYRREQNTDFLFSYFKNLENFSFNASAGGNYMYQYAENNFAQTKTRGSGLIVPGIYTLNNIAPDNLDYGSRWSQKGIYSLYGLASLGFMDAVFLDLTARNDWSSTLPVENRSYFYPSASLSMLLNNMFNMGDQVSLAKIRGGWAMTGNDTGPYALMSVMNNQGAWGNETRLSTSGTMLLPDLKPEIQTSWEIGAELAFFQNRLRMEGTYYEAENKNQILSIGLPPSSGYSSRQINAGLLSSKGIELAMGGSPVMSNDWKWDLNVVYSKNRTRIEELAEGFNYYVLWTEANAGAVTRVGEEIGQLVSRVITRVNDPSSPYHGWPMKNSQGAYIRDDWQNYMEPGDNTAVIGNFNPKFLMGMQTSLSYKRWNLSASFDWRYGGQFISQSIRYMESDYLTKRWIDKALKLNHLSGPEIAQYLRDNAQRYLLPGGEYFVVVGGPTTATGGFPHTEDGIALNDGQFFPGVEGKYDNNGNFVLVREHLGDAGTPFRRWQNSYGWDFGETAMFDADFVKLREISMSYQLPSIKTLGIRDLTLSVYSRNIILWTKAKINVDPETAFQPSGNSFMQGIERYNVTPWSIPVGFKLNVSF